MKQLRENRPARATGHDNRKFRPEWAAGANGNGGGDWLEESDLGLNQTPAEQNRFERFRNAMSADFFRAISRHESDDERAGDRRQNYPDTEMIVNERAELGRKTLKENQVRDFRDEPKEGLCHQSADNADEKRQSRQNKHARISAKIA
jgi:hypothetical protein